MSTNKQRGLLVFIGTSVTTTLVSAFTKSDNYLSLLEVPVLSRATTISLLLNLCVCVTCVCYLCVLPVCVTPSLMAVLSFLCHLCVLPLITRQLSQ